MPAIRPAASHTADIDYPTRQQRGGGGGGADKTHSASLEISELQMVSSSGSIFH